MIDQDILKLCMRVNGMTAYYPQYNEINPTPIEPKPEMYGKYGWNRDVVAFVTPEGDYYVSPYCVEVINYLNEHGYENNYIHVPFSSSEEPSDGIKAHEWMKLCKEAKYLHNQKEKERKREQVKKMASAKHVSSLPLDIYEMSLEIPNSGLLVKHYGGETSIARPIPEFDLFNNIGTYCEKNNIVAFINDKGKTFVSPYSHEVVEILKNQDYRENEINVPLSTGEEIVDPSTNELWKKLSIGARETAKKRLAESRKKKYAEVAKRENLSVLPDDLYELCFPIPEEGIDTIWFGEKHEMVMPLDEWEREHAIGTFCVNKGKVAFVDDKGRTFVSPFASEIVAVLRKFGYKDRSMLVPFSNNEIPSDQFAALKWKQLCAVSQKDFELREEKRKVEKIRMLAEEKRITALPSNVYEISLKIPKEGFETTFLDNDRERTRPVQGYELELLLGTYCEYNGRIVFVDDKGDTYVSPYVEEISEKLVAAGYTHASLFVPLSSGEEIVDPEIAARWDSLCARLNENRFSK